MQVANFWLRGLTRFSNIEKPRPSRKLCRTAARNKVYTLQSEICNPRSCGCRSIVFAFRGVEQSSVGVTSILLPVSPRMQEHCLGLWGPRKVPFIFQIQNLRGELLGALSAPSKFTPEILSLRSSNSFLPLLQPPLQLRAQLATRLQLSS